MVLLNMITNKMLSLFILMCLALTFPQISYSRSYLSKRVDFKAQQFKQHKTHMFYSENGGNSKVIIRRAADFKFAVELTRNVMGETIETILTFVTKKDKMVIRLPSRSQKRWRLSQTADGNRINAKIHVPADAPVGVYQFQILLKDKRGRFIEELDLEHKIVILFNPWSKEDAAYFAEQHKLDDYVLNETGYTYSYNFVKIGQRPWIYGQFQSKVFDAILFVLNKAELTAAQRGDIVRVTRELTYLMNDDGYKNRGVLRGKWREPYGPLDGRPTTKPTDWTGSPEIYEQYLRRGGKTVGYGQCWVYAGILTTAYRALGIATRPVTNAVSAHSSKRDLTVDFYLDKYGNMMKGYDSVWNYHVWVQAWFRRSDIGEQYSGWQDLDATPKLLNDGHLQMGPAPMLAIRNSHLRTNFETAYFYEEINADEVVWSYDRKYILIKNKKIGLSVTTKQYGTNKPEDITRMYKPIEGSEAERRSYAKAAKSLGIRPPSLNAITPRSGKNDILIDIKTAQQITIGSPVSVKVNFKNPSLKSKKLNVSVKATAMYYNGEEANVLKTMSQTLMVTNLKPAKIDFLIEPKEYFFKLRDDYTIRIEAVAKDNEILGFEKHLFSLEAPNLIISPLPPVRVNQTFTMNIKVQNPLNQTLNQCHIAIEGIRIPRQIVKLKDIPASSVATEELKLKSMYSLQEKIVVQFNSNDLLKMQSSIELPVRGKPLFQFTEYQLKQNHIMSEQH